MQTNDAKSEADVVGRLTEFIRRQFDVPDSDAQFNEDVHLFDYGYIDSFGAVALTEYVEQSFGVTVSQSDLIVHPMNTVREIATFVVKRRSGEI